ncbi:NAT_SF domain containing protein [Rhabdaerophilaceae bacterium]
MSLSIRTAVASDLPAVRELLVTTWHDTYDAILGQDKVADVTARWHSLEALKRQIDAATNEPDAFAFMISEWRGEISGTASARRDREVKDHLHLDRLYILPRKQGSGTGRALLCATLARFPAAQAVELNVQPANHRAIDFYRRHGFFVVNTGNACGGDQSAAVLHLTMAARLPILALRPARDSDAQDLYGLLTLCFAEYPGCFSDPHGDLADLITPGRWSERRAIDGRALGGEFLVVEDERGRVYASVAYDFPADPVGDRVSAELHRLYVRPDHRGKGVAEALVKRIEDRVQQRGATHLQFWSDTRFEAAHRLYTRLGYERGCIRALGDISNSNEYFFDKPLRS